jgi:hypothetical protein
MGLELKSGLTMTKYQLAINRYNGWGWDLTAGNKYRVGAGISKYLQRGLWRRTCSVSFEENTCTYEE